MDDELEYDVFMKGNQVEIPTTLQAKILQKLHIGHSVW